MKKQTKLESQAQAEQTSEEQTQQAAPTEFDSVEAMLRHDTINTPVPPTIERRLQESLGPAPGSPWWRKWLGK